MNLSDKIIMLTEVDGELFLRVYDNGKLIVDRYLNTQKKISMIAELANSLRNQKLWER